MNVIASINNVSVSFRDNIALRNISLQINEGAFVSVIGPNGAGKTTLLTVVNGLGKILSGSVEVFGKTLSARNVNAIRKDIGYVPQHLTIDARSPISVREAVMVGRFARIGLFKKWDSYNEDIVQNAMRVVGIEALAGKPIGHLSGGEHQKVSIARAIAQQPKIILLDEPTSNLDPKAQNDILSLVERIYRENKYTVLFVTHILTHIPHSCTDVVLMKAGTITNAGPADAMLETEVLSELYDFPMMVSVVHGRKHFHSGHFHDGHDKVNHV